MSETRGTAEIRAEIAAERQRLDADRAQRVQARVRVGSHYAHARGLGRELALGAAHVGPLRECVARDADRDLERSDWDRPRRAQ